MALNLDTRQRAMLLEMGLKVWAPLPAAAPQAHGPAHPAAVQPPKAPTPSQVPRPSPTTAPVAPATPATPAALLTPAAWMLGPARAVYPQTSASTPALPRWLIVCDGPLLDKTEQAKAEQLLDNMLRALRLQHNPGVFMAPLQTAAGQSAAQTLAQIQPHVILALGLTAARTLLGGTEHLGALRAQAHQLEGLPVVVSYAPTHLLRTPQAKAAAWADLCHAQALAQR